MITPPVQPRMARKQITPVNSPQKDKYGDRFIPSRVGNNWQVNFNLIQVSGSLIIDMKNVGDIRDLVKSYRPRLMLTENIQ